MLNIVLGMNNDSDFEDVDEQETPIETFEENSAGIADLRQDFEKAIQHDEERHCKTNTQPAKAHQLPLEQDQNNDITQTLTSLELNSENCNSDSLEKDTISKCKNSDKESLQRQYEMVERLFSDVRSVRSTTTASTIAPDVIKNKVKKALDHKQKCDDRKRCVVKGEASAVTRSRRENRANIKDSTGIWGWE